MTDSAVRGHDLVIHGAIKARHGKRNPNLPRLTVEVPRWMWRKVPEVGER